jgi:pimeloyl-ACP methyl ester carboxylesterase
MTKQQVLPGVYVEPHIIDTPKGKIEYDLSDGKGPVVLSVHAGLGGADQGRLIADWLVRDGYRVLSPSRPGYLGTPLDSGRTFEEQADLLAALVDGLEIKKVIMTSLSAGGPIAYAFAAKYPGRILALIAIASVSGDYTMPESAGPATQAIFMSTPGQKIIGKFMDMFPRVFLSGALGSIGYMTKQQRKAYVEYVLKTPGGFAFMKGIMDTMHPYSKRTQGNDNDMKQFLTMPPLPFAKITCPVLIIHGTHDADVKFYDGVRAFEHIKGAERYWIEHGDHLAFWLSSDAPKAQAYALEFIKRHTRT